MRWNFHVSPSRTIVWPALLPPWKRTTTSARSARRSTTLPLPSSPHWAPTMTVPGTAGDCDDSARGSVALGTQVALVRPEEGQRIATDLDQARDRAGADLLLEGGLVEVRRHQHRALR